LFDIKAGFIHAPKLWVAYVGGLLWWLSDEDPNIENNLIIGGGRGKTDPINWQKKCGNPQDDSYILWNGRPISKNDLLPKNIDIQKPNKVTNESPLISMPRQAQDEFKKVFFEFINGNSDTSFSNISSKLEIYNGSTSTGFCNIVNKMITTVDDNGFGVEINDKYYIKKSSIVNNFINRLCKHNGIYSK
jgi:hypothetical protein